jgi:hypothetical protein
MKKIKLNWVSTLFTVLIFMAAPVYVFAFTVNGHVECLTTGGVPFGAIVKVYDVDPLPGGSFNVDAAPLSTAIVDINGDFSLTFSWPTPWLGFEVGGPDLIFQFVQNIDGSFTDIYAEMPATGTHWNVTDGSSLTFEITSILAICTNSAIDTSDIPPDSLFLFTRVGNCETADIDCKGNVSTSEGYYRPRKAPYNFTGMDSDQPFGRTLYLFGWFGKKCDIDYYKVQYSTDNGSTWNDIETSLPNKWFDTSDPDPFNWHWVSESMGPFSDGGLKNLYKVPFFVRPNTPWSWLDRVAIFNTTVTADGLNRIRIKGYKWAGSSLVEATISDMYIVPNYGEIVLQIDNSLPSIEIVDLKLNGASKQVCQILDFGTGAGDKISVNFRVWDNRGHLRNYVVNAMYGHDCYINPRPTLPNKAYDTYSSNASGSPSWKGSMSYTTEYRGSTYSTGGSSPILDCHSMPFDSMPLSVMPTCAYQFRLGVRKRTTNGYGLIYYGEDTWHITIQRP